MEEFTNVSDMRDLPNPEIGDTSQLNLDYSPAELMLRRTIEQGKILQRVIDGVKEDVFNLTGKRL